MAREPKPIEFNQFRVLPHRREVLVNDEPTEIGGRMFDALMTLIEAPGSVVSKDVLMERVWPNQIVEVNSLHAVISGLRRALADRSLIRTVQGRGYQFTGALRSGAVLSSLPATAKTADPQPPPFPTNLPEPVSEFIGRDSELSRVVELISAHRVVTITGTGGIGKTRLAVEVGRRLFANFPDGTWIAELGSLADPVLVPTTLAAAIGIEVSGDLTVERISNAVGSRKILLVLDNCEHLIDAAARLVEALTRHNRQTRIIVTSREPLRVEGEWVSALPPLTMPQCGDQDRNSLLSYGALRLFTIRASAAGLDIPDPDASAPTIVEICRHLDGIPLAIELAAARAAVLGIEELKSRLDDQFELLRGERRTSVVRQRTLRATIDWSYNLLSSGERRLLHHLSVFAGSFTAAAVRVIASSVDVKPSDPVADIMSLVAKSLVVTELGGDGTTRFRLLEATRAYALEKLAVSGEVDEVARRHAEYYRDLLSDKSSGAAAVVETENVRAALDWAFSTTGIPAIGIAITVAWAPHWFQFSRMDEYRRRVERALMSVGVDCAGDVRLEMRLRVAHAEVLRYPKGCTVQAEKAWTTTLRRAEELNDVEFLHMALWGLWSHHMGIGQIKSAMEPAKRFAALAANGPETIFRPAGKLLLGTAQHYLGEQARARRHLEEVIVAYDSLDDVHSGLPYDNRQLACGFLARVLWVQGFPERSMHLAKAAAGNLDEPRHSPSTCTVLALGACPVSLLAGDLAGAKAYAAALFRHSSRDALDPWAAWGRSIESMLLIEQGEKSRGISCLRTQIDEMRDTGYMLPYTALFGVVAECLSELGQINEGLTTVDEALEHSMNTEELWCRPELLRIKGVLLQLKGELDTAEDYLLRGIELARKQDALSWELRCATSLARLWGDRAQPDARTLLKSIYWRFTEGFETRDLRTAKAIIEADAP